MDEYERTRDEAAMAKILTSADLKLHGVPRDRKARQRMEAVLGPVRPAKVAGEYDVLRFGMR